MVTTAQDAKRLWALEPGIRYLNHGAYGACPTSLLEVQAGWRARMERQPARFFMSELGALLRDAAAHLAAFVGAQPDRLGFVDNATTGVNAVIAALPLGPGDEILTTDHVYNAVRLTLRHHADRAGATIVEAPLPMPLPGPEAVIEAVVSRVGPRTRLVLLDHVASRSAAVMPIGPIIAAARQAGIPVLVDGAHAPGLVALDLDALGATWYVGNCHKWLCSPKGAGFIAVGEAPPFEVHPPVISHDYGRGFTAEFDKTGTRDVSAWLTVPAAIALHDRLGGAALRARNAAVAAEAAHRLAAELGTAAGAPPGMFAAMATVRVPGTLPADWAAANAIREALWQQARIELPVVPLDGALWLRLSVQLYNDAADFDGLAEAVRAAIPVSC